MVTVLPTSLQAALDFSATGAECTVRLTPDIAFGAVSCGGYTASVMAKYAVLYASQQPKICTQTDIRSAVAQFYRPIFPQSSTTMKLREVSIGKGWSTLRVELSQGGKVAASVDVIVSNFSLPSLSLETKWQLSPPPHPVDLSKLESDSDPDWVSYQTAFYPDGFRRSDSYVKSFIPKTWPSDITHVEQWVVPGWDCLPLGSCAAEKEEDKARWTNEMIQFVLDCSLPVEQNYYPLKPGQHPPMGSVASTLSFAAIQKKAREEGKPDWRALEYDGSKVAQKHGIPGTLVMATEIKKKLPPEGVRWLYLRTAVKSVMNGRVNREALLFDEAMELVAISNHIVQIIPAGNKDQKIEARASL
ncbi:hypothetical protein PT974_09979 [Cladobotryum mycophilum]|uniref:Thioesterase-like superfamily-domain-containing protein n=1 Tax=Cladobotryum mycophilum TaxID=491253 RepID=A0ABR0S8K2_9HYPO